MSPLLLGFGELPYPSPSGPSNTNQSRWTYINLKTKGILLACIFIILFLVLIIIVTQIVFTQPINIQQSQKQYPPRVDGIVPITRRTSITTEGKNTS